MNKGLVIGIGAAGVAVVAYLLYKKSNAATQTAAASASLPSSSSTVPPSAANAPYVTPSAPVTSVRQTMWKDRDNNIFELTGTKQRWGYVIKVNGSIQAKNNQAEVLALGPDGYMVSADNNGTTNVYKNGGWQNVIRDNKTATAEYLAKLGVKYPTGDFSGLGNAYLLN